MSHFHVRPHSEFQGGHEFWRTLCTPAQEPLILPCPGRLAWHPHAFQASGWGHLSKWGAPRPRETHRSPRGPGTPGWLGSTAWGLSHMETSLHPCSGARQPLRKCATMTQEPLARTRRCSSRTGWTSPWAPKGAEQGQPQLPGVRLSHRVSSEVPTPPGWHLLTLLQL